MTRERRRALLLPVAVLALALILPLTILLGSAWLFGWRFQPVETGSMAPAMPIGSLAVVQPVDPTRIGPGVTIVFEDPLDPSRLVAHRIVETLPGTLPHWRTKGDANREADPLPVSVTSVRGVVGWSVGGLGWAVTNLRGGPAFLLLVGLPLGLLAITEVAAVRSRRRGATTIG
jgi:signal peptidase